MAVPKVPERLRLAIQVLDVQPEDLILEIGGGPGVAAALICEQLGAGGRLVGIDRSETAIGRAERLNAAYMDAGKAEFRQCSLNELAPGGERFNKILAVNVNVFWTKPGGVELSIIKELLRPEGVVQLVFEMPPGSGKADRVSATVLDRLTRNGFAAGTANSTSSILCITAVPVKPGP